MRPCKLQRSSSHRTSYPCPPVLLIVPTGIFLGYPLCALLPYRYVSYIIPVVSMVIAHSTQHTAHSTQHTAHSKTYSVIAHSKTYSDIHRSRRTFTLSVGHRCTRDAALLVPHRPCCNMLHGSTPLHRETTLDPDPSRLWGAHAADGSVNKSTANVAKNTHYYRITTHT